MKEISLKEGKYYLGSGLLEKSAELIRKNINPRKVLIISDENVFPLYGESLKASLDAAGIINEFMIFKAGEDSKCLLSFEKILSRLSEGNYSRSDALIALGGGVIGDLGGFGASCFKRGMKLVQIPTSLLAMVDSSVGGKTGLNLGKYKNQIGSFYEPHVCIADTDCLFSLNEREYKCGCGEIIKYAVLFDRAFFESLLNTPVKDRYENVIEKCVSFKRDIVLKDERDRGCRQLLNFGHTAGHAIETLSDFNMAHGEAVAAGMAYITRASADLNYCKRDCYEDLCGILKAYGLPVGCEFSPSELYSLILKDKKITGDKINLIIPVKIGSCRIAPVDSRELLSILNSGALK